MASSSSNEWNPAIAASSRGEVAIAWDGYRKGDYDVYFRTFDSAGCPGEEKPVAASRRYEACPTLAYDPAGRLWMAWEESDEDWGKDWGVYSTSAIAVYHGRWLGIRGFENGQAFAGGDLGAVPPGVPNAWVESTARQNDARYGAHN